MEKKLHNAAELQSEATQFITTLTPKESGATLITLSGELGAGKTTFTQGVAKALGVVVPVTSPTFVLMKRYPLENKPFTSLIHIDAYRLTGGAALAPLEFTEALQEKGNLILLEWPEQVEDGLPAPDHTIKLSVLPEGGRLLSFE